MDLTATGGKVHGYGEGIGATLGAREGNGVTLTLSKNGRIRSSRTFESDAWSVDLTKGEFSLDRSRVSIEVIARLGASGQFDFTFTGKPHRISAPCGGTQDVAQGTIKGMIRIRTGERFFKTVKITRMRGRAADLPVGEKCSPSCPRPYYSLAASTQRAPSAGNLSLGATTVPGSPGLSDAEGFAVDGPTSGTPFALIQHSITVVRKRPFFTTGPRLGGTTLTTPGGILTGSLKVRASTPPDSLGWKTCRGRRYHSIGRGERVVAGRITARFDSIGKRVFGRALTAANMDRYKRVS